MFFQRNRSISNSVKEIFSEEYGTQVTFKELKSGTENINYLIDNKVVARILYISNKSIIYDKSYEYLQREVEFTNYLFDQGINNLFYEKFKNNKRILYKEIDKGTIYFLQYKYINGSLLTYTRENIKKIAEKMYNFHEFSKKFKFERCSVDRISEYDDLPSSLHYRDFKFDNKIEEIVDGYIEYWGIFKQNSLEITEYIKKQEEVLIHNDLHRKNILVTENSLCIIDFGDTRYSIIEEDIGTFLWGMSLEIDDLEIFKYMVDLFFTSYCKCFKKVTKLYCYKFALQRYLDIHMYYLNKNRSYHENMKYQVKKFSKERKIINYLIRVIEDET